MTPSIHLTITAIIRDATQCYGFAVADDGESEYFIPRSTVLYNDLTEQDVGRGFNGTVQRTHKISSGRPNFDHVQRELDFDVSA